MTRDCLIEHRRSVCNSSSFFSQCSLTQGECGCSDVREQLHVATPGSRCQAGVVVWARRPLCCPPAGPAAALACCTTGTLSSPPAIWWGTFDERHVCMDKSPAHLSVWTPPSTPHRSHANLTLWPFPFGWLVCRHKAPCVPGAVVLLNSSRRVGWGWTQRWLSQIPRCRYWEEGSGTLYLASWNCSVGSRSSWIINNPRLQSWFRCCD